MYEQSCTNSCSDIKECKSKQEFCFRIYSNWFVQYFKEQPISDSFQVLTVEAEDFESAKWGASVYAFWLERQAKAQTPRANRGELNKPKYDLESGHVV